MKSKNLSLQRGLSLIELMIGLLLSAMLLWGVLQVFDANRRTSNLQLGFSSIQERGRLATDILARELRNAAFTGCVANTGNITSYLDQSSSAYVANVHNFFSGNAIDGNNNVTTLTIGATGVVAGTDTLSVRGAVDACAGVGRMLDPTAVGEIRVSGECDLPVGEVAMVANCLAADIFTISGQTAGPGARTVSYENTVPAGSIPNQSVLLARPYGAESSLYLPYVREYFIAENAGGERGLFMRENGSAVQELIPGVEDMQVLYGRDQNGDNVPDVWSESPANAVESAQVVSVRTQFLISTDERVGANDFTFTDFDGAATSFADGRLRKVFNATTKLRNRGEK